MGRLESDVEPSAKVRVAGDPSPGIVFRGRVSWRIWRESRINPGRHARFQIPIVPSMRNTFWMSDLAC
jgi:hypothetical protein